MLKRKLKRIASVSFSSLSLCLILAAKIPMRGCDPVPPKHQRVLRKNFFEFNPGAGKAAARAVSRQNVNKDLREEDREREEARRLKQKNCKTCKGTGKDSLFGFPCSECQPKLEEIFKI